MEKGDDKKIFGASVKAWREMRGVSQAQLAERAGLRRTYVSDVERGSRNVSLKNITKLARSLEVSVAALFPPPGPMKNPGASQARDPERKLVDILLVEDNPDDVALTAQAFKQKRFINLVFVARDGEEALDYLFGRGTAGQRRLANPPDVILLDLNLPKVGGLEILRRLKADPRMRMIPVIVLTNSQMFSDIEECQRLGANSFIVKPVDFQSLSRITPLLNLEWALFKPSGLESPPASQPMAVPG
jgi:CheY-like chemotaxis protein/DNA-binding XRE family transcriptional regulator